MYERHVRNAFLGLVMLAVAGVVYGVYRLVLFVLALVRRVPSL